MNAIHLLKNHFNRILTQKVIIIVAVIVVPIMIGAAILFSEKAETKETIALVSTKAQSVPSTNKLHVEVMNIKPATSMLLLGKYAAIVEEKEGGAYAVTAIKGNMDQKSIENYFNTGVISKSGQGKDKTVRGMGTNILGFILMIVLIQGVALTTLYPEDRNLKTFRRVLTAPVSERLYLLVQGIFTFLSVYIPTYLAIVITKLCFGAQIGFGLGMLALLIGVLSALSTALSLFFTSAIENNSSLVSTAIYVITCVLAGCFYSFTGSNKVLDSLCSYLPQKVYLTLSEGLENGQSLMELKGQFIYIIVWIVALWFMGSMITKRKMNKGTY